MLFPPLFSALSSTRIASLIREAKGRVVYAAPGIWDKPAAALVELTERPAVPCLTISLDFDERTLRMGYGSLAAVKLLRDAGVTATHSPGFRNGILIVDSRGWVFTPVAHYLEDEPQSDETPNAIELSSAQVEAFAIRLCPTTKEHSISKEANPEKGMSVAEQPQELGIATISESHFQEVAEAIETAPPVRFDVVRQVRVFEPYLQYVEMKLSGAAIQKHKVSIPPDVQKLGSSKDLEGRLRTTFDLIDKRSTLSSQKLEDGLNGIRKSFTPSLGRHHGRVMLKRAKPLLEARIAELRTRLEEHQETIRETLQDTLAKSRAQVLDYYLPLALNSPPDSLVAQSISGKITESDTRRWLDRRLANVFPKAEELIQKMALEVTFKDVTFETLNRPDFLESVKVAFPDIDWDSAYDEFRAAGETQS